MNHGLAARNGWSAWHLPAAVAAAGVVSAILADVWRDILRLAGDEEASHIWLVPLAVVWLVLVRRGRFRQCRPTGGLVGSLIIAVGGFLWSYGYRNEVQALWHGGAILLVVGTLLTVLGKDVFFNFLPAFVVLAFAIPVPSIARQQVAIPLERVTAHATQVLGEILGMNVVRQGNLLSINGIDVAIVEACNGMRMVFTLFLACYVFAFITPLRGYVRVLILVASPLLAVVCNVLRLVPTVWMFGHASTSTAEVFHDASGWVMLLVAFGLLTGITRLLRWAMIPVMRYPLAGH